MRTRKQIQPGERLPLKLTAAERALVLEGLLCLDPEAEQIIKNTPTAQPVMMALDELVDFGGHIAAEANHCQDKKKQKKLDAIFEKIEELLDKFTDQERPIDRANHRTDSLPSKTAGPSASKSSKKSRTKSPAGSDKLFQFKITLLGSQPPIWRRIQIPDCTLDKLHEHIQAAMGWTNSHLHQFNIKGRLYGDPQLLDEGIGDFECVDSTRTMVSEIVPKTAKRYAFKYEYDFGDGWEHEVLFEGNPAAEKAMKYPICLEGERACPPEDIGRIWGYYDFLEAIADSKHEEHERYLEWYGGKFSPDQFDLAKATRQMKTGLPNWRTI